jgi:ABC-type Zn uptake system ZnuABC Zn-binding protein ZnuA
MRLNIIGLVACALLWSGCTRPTTDEPQGLRVVATTTQVGSVAREVGGDAIDLTVLLQPGVEAHDFELTPRAAAAIEDADLILMSGAGLETWLEDALTTIGASGSVHDMSAGVDLRTAEPEDSTDQEGTPDIDPHYWLSGPNAIRMVENVRDALIQADSESTAAFETRADVLIGRLEAADTEVRRLIGEIPLEARGIVTNHDALGYFIDEYGLRFVGSVFPVLDASAEPNPAQLADLVDVIRAEGVRAIFSESAVNPRLADAIAAESGARVVDDPLFADSLGPPGSGAETLDGMLLHNARVIHDALSTAS